MMSWPGLTHSKPSCAGKSTTTNLLTSCGFIRYEGDTWCVGGDPIKEPDLIPTPALLKTRPSEMAKAVTEAIGVGRTKLGKGEYVPWKVWEDFYRLLSRDIASRCGTMREQDFIITFAVYQRSERDYLREMLGRNLTFLLLNVPEELLAERIHDRTRHKAKEKGMTLEEYCSAFHPGKTATEVFADWKLRRSGFQPKQLDEPNTVQIDVTWEMSKDHVARAAAELLGFPQTRMRVLA